MCFYSFIMPLIVSLVFLSLPSSLATLFNLLPFLNVSQYNMALLCLIYSLYAKKKKKQILPDFLFLCLQCSLFFTFPFFLCYISTHLYFVSSNALPSFLYLGHDWCCLPVLVSQRHMTYSFSYRLCSFFLCAKTLFLLLLEHFCLPILISHFLLLPIPVPFFFFNYPPLSLSFYFLYISFIYTFLVCLPTLTPLSIFSLFPRFSTLSSSTFSHPFVVFYPFFFLSPCLFCLPPVQLCSPPPLLNNYPHIRTSPSPSLHEPYNKLPNIPLPFTNPTTFHF
ncbi:unnamed protein product [Acanthosepion pharaonis]|uniref:Uncharacterized protein n=1 Tax=Acanthosepion pharaonis TaxID=158019 RepID=A0A812BI53_ACAPH|nr:unnamed protein product [Sepia pharaonis]